MSSTTNSFPSRRLSGQQGSAAFRTLALTGLVSTIVLIMIGSFVRVSGNGLGCPDWPLCYGRAVPPLDYSAWVEFSHRLLGGFVGVQIVALGILAWSSDRQNKWLWRPASLAVVLLAVQVGLGGLHVLNELPSWTGLVHTGVAMALAGLVAVLVAATQPSLGRLRLEAPALFERTSLARWSVVGATATYTLILTGSLVTRSGASLACPSFPHCGVAVMPAQLQPYVTIQLLHRFTAFTVAGALLVTVYYLWRYGREQRAVRSLSLALGTLLLAQFALGISNVVFAIPMWSRVLHLGTGAAIWSLMVLMAVALNRPQVSP